MGGSRYADGPNGACAMWASSDVLDSGSRTPASIARAAFLHSALNVQLMINT